MELTSHVAVNALCVTENIPKKGEYLSQERRLALGNRVRMRVIQENKCTD